MTTTFSQKKIKILSQLSVPDTEYADASPKGSVDSGIRDLIDEINALEGIVTTSSCAGRVSVYLEGHKKATTTKSTKWQHELRRMRDTDVSKECGLSLPDSAKDTIPPSGEELLPEIAASKGTTTDGSSSTAGGKGGGDWLFVSHDPLPPLASFGGDYSDWAGLFGLDREDALGTTDTVTGDDHGAGQSKRLIHFKFEPMILHVLTASQEHAQMVVQAGMNAGFRETGAVSLLARHHNEEANPMVAVRSTGLSFESLIGVESASGGGRCCIVSPEYLHLLVQVSHERFAENRKRIERFRAALKTAFAKPPGAENKKTTPEGWEDSNARRERKRLEGLKRREELRKKEEESPAKEATTTTDEEQSQDPDLGFGVFL
ncbi:methyltransferase TYW3-domain-containing protein [Apodospora peruviana]|uniref:tRNA(Phe) 7-[(3-amino-3-carboxypropyl)-4-demethylwyosine(37)-N(4)]-methyltransferase n=1 Tax=Apodospora peruviana TaxID=516989 RepID=A0AAE0MFV7_9PEZI|nr:methyltransferase TYW3-domain-containing protein [Apodospora peruviana]